jgi:VWFA-related protein
MRSISWALLLSILAANALLPQQKPQPQKSPQQAVQPSNGPAKFGATVNLVVETVFAKDKNGNTVEGLTAKDFVVTEDNQPQTILFCEFEKMVDGPATAEAPAPAAAPPIPAAAEAEKSKVDPVTRTQIMPETPGDIKYRDRRLLTLYFDMTAMPVPDQYRALDSAQKFITKQMKSADLMAIIKYDGEAVRVLQDFTDNRDDLMKAINKMAIGEGSGLDESTNDADAADTGSAFGEDDSEFNLFNTNRQLAALQTAVKMLGALNEKKVLIYFASGLTLNGVDNQAQFQATTNAAIRANTTFFTIDARGLVAMAPMGDATRGSPGGAAMYSGAGALANTTRFQKSQDTLYALASDTGGKALLDNNDLAEGLVNAEASISSYYIIGYNTTNTKLDGKFRRIKISLKEDTTAKLDYRQGYYANKTFDKFTGSDKERQLQDALMLGDPMTELTIAMEVNYFQLNSAEYFIPIVMKIPGSELALARKGGAEHTVIEFIGEVKDEYGSTVGNIRDRVDIKLTGATAAQLVKQPIEYDTNQVLLPGSYSVKVLARDDETGRIGTYMKKFVIPNLNKELTKVPISSVVLSGQRIDMKNALFTVKDTKAGPSVNPLIQDGIKLLPSVNRVFSKSRDMYVYLQAYERGAETMRPLVAFVTFYRGQTKAFETPPLGVTQGMDAKSKAVPMRFSLALSKLPPGKYDCQVTVVDPTGQKANFWQAPVLLVP